MRKKQKYSIDKHKDRLKKIIESWNEIIEIINEEVPSGKEIEKILDSIGAPKSCDEIEIDKETCQMTFKTSKDIRDKYVLSRLYWDLGIIDSVEIY